ncbi:MAG TPA: PLP-dependent aminotransferase family protein [Aquihabitans sp.]|nr:PLP-dependent aminotransferase family protein [Aquihabitans sp.]
MVKPTLLAYPRPPIGRGPQRIGSSAIRDLLAIAQRPDVISLAGGLPDPDTFPTDAIARATAELLAGDPASVLQYGPTDGCDALREVVAASAGADPAGVLVTSGSQQALDLVARTVLDPGDVAVVADPAYVGALQALRGSGAELAPIPSDEHGLRVDLLADALHAGLRPKLVHVVATFDNPTGATLDPRRRVALAELAEEFGFWIVDDDPYGAIRWRGTSPSPLRTLTDRTIALGSTSKVLCPGLRVGWAIAPPELETALAIVKQSADLHTSALSQQIAARLLGDRQAMGEQLDRLRRTYRARAEALGRALERHLPGTLAFTPPAGGMFLWCRLADHVRPEATTTELLGEALDAGVAFVPGAAFAAGPGGHDRHLRLSFATGAPAELDEAARRLATVLR